ncbi:MAG TPA: hypothetical protein VEZ46_17250 [Mycobacteriales bacterium]|jgi:hypothetical protein|nr:hypothetical protein [Mycobacteriales bacterium]
MHSAVRRLAHVLRFVVNLPVTVPAVVWGMLHGGLPEMRSGLFIACGGMHGGFAKGGTTFGNVWLYGALADEARLRHEAKHATQWALCTPVLFPVLYLLAELAARRDPKRNVFERWADLADGGYL